MSQGISYTEQKVLNELIKDGPSDREIAERLGMSVHTVRTHLGHVRFKTHLRSRTAIALWWARAVGSI